MILLFRRRRDSCDMHFRLLERLLLLNRGSRPRSCQLSMLTITSAVGDLILRSRSNIACKQMQPDERLRGCSAPGLTTILYLSRSTRAFSPRLWMFCSSTWAHEKSFSADSLATFACSIR